MNETTTNQDLIECGLDQNTVTEINNNVTSSSVSCTTQGYFGLVGTNTTDGGPGSIERLLTLVAFLGIDVMGLIGNGMVIAVILWGRNMRTSANHFIFSLGVADLLVCLWVIPNVIVSRWTGRWTMGDKMCVFQAFINHSTLFSSIFNLTAVAVNRLVATRYFNKYPLLFSSKLSLMYILIAWFVALLYSLLPIIGWGKYDFDTKRSNCIFSRKAAPSFSIFFSSCCVILPFFISVVCYVMIWLTFIKSRRTVNLLGDVTMSGVTDLSEKKLTKNLFVVLLVFFLCWLPINLLFLVDPQGNLSGSVYTFAVGTLLCNSCVNPIIYGTRRKYRTEYMRLVKMLRYRGRSNHQELNTIPSSNQRPTPVAS